MKKNQRQNWENTIANMNPNNQLELASILIEELKTNEYGLDKADNYDNSASQEIRLFLQQYIQQSKTKLEARKGLEILKSFFSLSSDNQTKIITSLSSEISSALKKETVAQRALECKQSSHQFGKWDAYTINHGPSQEAITRNNDYREWIETIWFRICTNCGHREETKQCPQVVFEQQQEKTRQDKIKQLKKELKTLEQDN